MARHAVRIGVVGVGKLGRFHARNLRTSVPGAELVGVADADPVRTMSVAEELEVIGFPTVEGLLSADRLDAVLIATSTSRHIDVIEAATQRGLHIFCEKPIALNEEETTRALELVEKAGVLLQIGFHRRFDRDFVDLRERIEREELGRLYWLRLSHRDMAGPDPAGYMELDGPLLVNVTIHDLDTVRWLVGEVAEISVMGGSVADPRYGELGDYDHAVITVRFENGALGVIDNSRCAGYGYECSAEVVGSLATGRISQPPASNLSMLSAGLETRRTLADHTARHREAYIAELAAFIDAVATGAESPVPGADGLTAFSLAQLAVRSAQGSGRHLTVDAELSPLGLVYTELDRVRS
jgi:predicted dehydrogenase